MNRKQARAALGVSRDAADRLIVALDLPSAREALRLTDELAGRCRWVKVGMELFYAEGKGLIEHLRARNFRIFLDLKLHDIPNTVASAIRSLASLGVDLLTVHAAGGEAMLRSAADLAAILPKAPALAAVTVLTSMDEPQLEAIGVQDTPAEQVSRLAKLALGSGLNALVASPLEVRSLRANFGMEPTLIVPGIRPQGTANNDQSRVATPRSAIADGASLLVVGRPITEAGDPAEAVDRILEAIALGVQDFEASTGPASNR